jgi:NAD(P)-dependent dehydrogenase (short-subunit alcohol dehydrogenase family)
MGFFHYLFRYRLRDIRDFLRNESKDPAPCDERLDGKTAVITGATSGIGYCAAHRLAAAGADLVLCNRNPLRSAEVERELRERHGRKVTTILADFSSLEQTRECARALAKHPAPLDVLIYNSGVYHTKRTFSCDGIEMVFQVNHLSSFYLNRLLQERLVAENRARVIFVNSEGHRFALGGVHLGDLEWKLHRYSGLRSYGAAKTAQLLTMLRFAREYEGTALTVNAMHPGNVRSNIGENNGKLYRLIKRKLVLSTAKDPDLSARALHYLAASPGLQGVSGRFFNLTTEEIPAPHAVDPDLVEPTWRKSLELCGLA